MKATARKRRPAAASLEVFFERYSAILFAARDFIAKVAEVAARSKEDPYCTTVAVAEHLAKHRPAAYLKTYGADEPHELKVWRLKTILSNARHLGAYEALGIRTLRGRGLTVEVRRLRVVK